MRREFIYPHRSVRIFPVSRGRVCTVLGIAVIICSCVFLFSSPLLDFHSQLSGFLLKFCGIPVSGLQSINVFSFLSPVEAHSISIPHYQENPWRFAVIFFISFAVMVWIYRKIPLGRSFMIFLMILLIAASFVILLHPSFHMSSTAYEQIWVRGEFLVWILLPWISAILFSCTIPSLLHAVAWGLFLQVYAVIWSAVRLVFCLGVFHYTGIIFLPLLWFCFGILFDLVYIMVFFSFALRLSMKQALGGRKS